MAHHDHGKGMLVLIGGLLVVSFLYFVSVMKKDDPAASQDEKLKKSNKPNSSQTSCGTDVTNNMECSESIPKFVCSICGSKPMAIKIEERVEESTTTTCEIIEDNSFSRVDNYSRRVPFPEAGVDIIDRKLKNTEESLRKEIDEYCSENDDVLTYSESWTENWLFRKKENKRDKAHASFKPVSMFVPNTTAKYRAMIGDQNVDEISDLSDCSIDSDELEEEKFEGEEPTTTRRKVRMAKYIYDQRSRVFIDGKSSKHHVEELNMKNKDEATNGYVNFSLTIVNSSDNTNVNLQREIKAEKNVSQEMFSSTALNDDVTNEKSSNSAESNRSCYRSELFIEPRDVNQNSTLSDDKLSDIDFNLFSPPKPGTIADREHRKWQTAAPMENNPYSEENLQKRLMEKKYTPKYSSASSLLGIARINGLDDGKSVDATSQVIVDDIVFKTIDLLAEKSSVNCDNNNTPIIESRNVEIVISKSTVDKSIVIDLPDKSNISRNNTPINMESKKVEIVKCKSSLPVKSIGRLSRLKESNAMSNDREDDETKNKSYKSKRSNSYNAIKVTKKNATTTINEVDYSSSDEKISLPSVKKLVEVFSQIQRATDITEPTLKLKHENKSEQEKPKFKRVERTLEQSSPRPLHLHSLTARSLSKEFREGLR